ncbi:hypothetical protein BTR23_04130 [Alkalihalophilus pseudofirmus]|nr:hypothetical protein BTR23_04130 [Alkalihalophilus pseudofirmus]
MSRGISAFLLGCCLMILIGCSEKSPEIPANAKLKDDMYCYSYEATGYVDCYPYFINDVEEHLELIRENLIPEDRTDTETYISYVEESLDIVQGLEEQFRSFQDEYGNDSIEFLNSLNDSHIIHCFDEDCMTYRLGMQYDTLPPDEWMAFNETLTTLFEEYFTLFLLNEHYSKTFSDARFLKNIDTSETRLSKLKTKTEKEWQALLEIYKESIITETFQEKEINEDIDTKKEDQSTNETAKPQPAETNNTSDIVITYKIDNSGFVSIDGPVDSVIHLKVGQKIHLQPTFIGDAYQKLYVYGDVVDFLDEYTIIARHTGTTDLEIVPNWEWDLSKVYTIFVE